MKVGVVGMGWDGGLTAAKLIELTNKSNQNKCVDCNYEFNKDYESKCPMCSCEVKRQYTVRPLTEVERIK